MHSRAIFVSCVIRLLTGGWPYGSELQTFVQSDNRFHGGFYSRVLPFQWEW